MRKILKTIKYIDEFDIDLFNKLNIGVEIQDFTEPNLTMKETIKIIDNYRTTLKRFNGIKALHGPFLDLRPASPDLKIREVSIKRYLDTLYRAMELDVDYIIFHSQINPYLKEPFLRGLNNRQNKEFWVDILNKTKYKGTILIENIFEESPDMLKEYIETINIPNIRINLDIGHAKLGKVSLEYWIKELKDYIDYIHIHSNNGVYDEHIAPSKEEIENLYQLLDRYNMEPPLSLEYKINDLEKEITKYL